MLKTLKQSFFYQEVISQKRSWLVFMVLSFMAAICEASFLGAFRYTLLSIENSTAPVPVWLIIVSGSSMFGIVYLRYSFNLSAQSRLSKLWAVMRTRDLYLQIRGGSWSSQRELQIQLDQSFQLGSKAIQAMTQLLVFFPILLWSQFYLFAFMVLVGLPVVLMASSKRKALKKNAKDLRVQREDLFKSMEKATHFQETWTHHELLNWNQKILKSEFSKWSEQDLILSLSEEKNKHQSEMWNALFMVTILLASVFGCYIGVLHFADLTLFYGCLLLSYGPIKNLSNYSALQTRVTEAIGVSLHNKLDKEIFEAGFNITTENMSVKQEVERCYIEENGSLVWKSAPLLYNEKILIPNLEFHFNEGIHVIYGFNGVGKTTLLNRVTEAIGKKHVLYLNQFPELPHYLIIEECFTFIDQGLIDILKLGEIQNLPTLAQRQFSGGEKQRILLALALHYRAKWTLLDEPISSVDFKSRSTMFQDICEYANSKNINLLMVHHDIMKNLEFVNCWELTFEGLRSHAV